MVFSIVQGFVFGHEARDRTYCCGLEIIGTRGVVKMEHDFDTVQVHLHGHSRTEHPTGPYVGKKLDVMAHRLAASIRAEEVTLPSARDSVIASRISWKMLEDAKKDLSIFGDAKDLDRILSLKKQEV